jgi:hypothetical protein
MSKFSDYAKTSVPSIKPKPELSPPPERQRRERQRLEPPRMLPVAEPAKAAEPFVPKRTPSLDELMKRGSVGWCSSHTRWGDYPGAHAEPPPDQYELWNRRLEEERLEWQPTLEAQEIELERRHAVAQLRGELEWIRGAYGERSDQFREAMSSLKALETKR